MTGVESRPAENVTGRRASGDRDHRMKRTPRRAASVPPTERRPAILLARDSERLIPIGFTVLALQHYDFNVLDAESDHAQTHTRRCRPRPDRRRRSALAACGGSSSQRASTWRWSPTRPPRAAYEKLIPAFQATPEGKGVTFSQSYGASGEQSRCGRQRAARRRRQLLAGTRRRTSSSRRGSSPRAGTRTRRTASSRTRSP